MNGNAELLNYIYQNSQMGVDTINQLIGVAKDVEFNRQLESQLKEYWSVNSTAKTMLNNHGFEEKGITSYEKVKTNIMVNLQTITDKTPSHISEMLMIGSNMGIIDATKNLKKYQDAEPEISNLMEKLLSIEESNVQQLKKFL